MRILLTNDDGIDAPGLKLLYSFAKTLGEVSVFAPHVEQSGKSHGIEFIKTLVMEETSYEEAVEAYRVHSTPADCVRFALLGLQRKYDLVLSGINRGLNVGQDIVYSGTVGAIMEANHMGIPAVALSTTVDGLDYAASTLPALLEFFKRNQLLSKHPLYNINIPNPSKNIRVTRQGEGYYADRFIGLGNNEYTQEGYSVPEPDFENGALDTVCMNTGITSVTPLRLNVDDLSAFELCKDSK